MTPERRPVVLVGVWLLISSAACATAPAHVADNEDRVTAAVAPVERPPAPRPAVVVKAWIPPPPPTPPPSWERCFLWRIDSRKGPTFLLGTMHFPDPRSLEMPLALREIVEGRNLGLVTELGLRDDVDVAHAFLSTTLLRNGQTLDDVLPPDLVVIARQRADEAGLNWSQVALLRPWAFGFLLSRKLTPSDGLPAADQDPNRPSASLDRMLEDRFHEAGRNVEGLETIEEQLKVFDGLSLADQASWLRLTLAIDFAAPRTRDTAVEDGFFSGDEAQLLAMFDRLGQAEHPFRARMMQRMLGDRNRVMAERILKRLRHGQSELIAVGVAHLLGNDSVIERLERAGRLVTRLQCGSLLQIH